MTVDTLVRDPQAAEEPRFERPQEAPVRPCANCGAGLAAGQDWCLECGTAAPGRLGRRPGMRAAATVVALTVALVAGAVTAGYAAINGDAGREVAKPPVASGAPIAQAPPATPTAPPATPAAPAAPLPRVAPPKTAAPAPAPAHPVAPAPAAHTPPAPAAPTHTTPTTSTPAHTPPAVTGPQPIDLGADAAQLYDPYKRAASSSDPADSYDDDPTTAWKVSTPADGKEMQLGLIVDLGKKRSIKQLDLQTSTPGFDVELYAADTAQAPPDILDTRWAHLHNGDGVAKKDSVRLASDSHKYRWVLMWFTAPPQKAPTVKISEFKILG
jgi:hypothetical protein